jgi:hypothetical protein
MAMPVSLRGEYGTVDEVELASPERLCTGLMAGSPPFGFGAAGSSDASLVLLL